jgi:hypothetical protein
MTTPTPQDAALQDAQEAAEARAGQDAVASTRRAWSYAALAGVSAGAAAVSGAGAAATPVPEMYTIGATVVFSGITLGSSAMAAHAATQATRQRKQQQRRHQDIELNVRTRATGAGHSASESLPSRPPAAHLPSRPAQGSSGRGR